MGHVILFLTPSKMQSDCCNLDAVKAIFNDYRNKEFLLRQIVGPDMQAPQLMEFETAISVAMQQALIRWPGTFQRSSFHSDEAFAHAVLDQVQAMNEYVIETERPKVAAYEQLMHWYYTQELTGIRDIPNTMELGTAPALKRRGNKVVNPIFTQWD